MRHALAVELAPLLIVEVQVRVVQDFVGEHLLRTGSAAVAARLLERGVDLADKHVALELRRRRVQLALRAGRRVAEERVLRERVVAVLELVLELVVLRRVHAALPREGGELVARVADLRLDRLQRHVRVARHRRLDHAGVVLRRRVGRLVRERVADAGR